MPTLKQRILKFMDFLLKYHQILEENPFIDVEGAWKKFQQAYPNFSRDKEDSDAYP